MRRGGVFRLLCRCPNPALGGVLMSIEVWDMDSQDFERQVTEALVGALAHLDGLTVQLARIAALVEEKERQEALFPPEWVNSGGSNLTNQEGR